MLAAVKEEINEAQSEVASLALRLIHRAGYKLNDTILPDGGQYAEEFAVLLKALNYIGDRKTDDYGDFRMQDIRSWDRETWGCYWDIQRKFGRMERQLTVAAEAGPAQMIVDDLMETCGDMAVYCVRMIQVLRRLEEKGMVPK